MAVINSLMDNDWYIFTMCQLFLHKHPEIIGRDAFKCRNPEETLFAEDKPSFKTMPELVDRLDEEIDNFCTLTFKENELFWLLIRPYFKPDYVDWLSGFRPRRRYIKVERKGDGTFGIRIEGPLTQQIWFEVPTLSTISQIYGEVAIDPEKARINGKRKIEENRTTLIPGLKVADFGTRRRHSFEHHKEAVNAFATMAKDNFVGTSNAYLAMLYGLTPIGTMAHKALCAYQALTHPILSQKALFHDWADEYRGDLGIALSDNFGMEQFLMDFDRYFAKLFDGARHDSDDPYKWGDLLIGHYIDMNVDPITKTGVFSDGLDFPKAVKIHIYFLHRLLTSFGIGTEFSNHIGYIPPQIVIKLVECNGLAVAKIADDPGKGMCESQIYVDYIHSLLGRKQQ